MLKFFRVLVLGLPMLFAMTGCGGAPASTSQETVQDIQPGGPSIIQPPATSQPAQDTRLEERSL